MKIYLSPINSKKRIVYQFSGETITATMDGLTDTFDFSAMPDGVAESITSTITPCPVLSAKRVDGVLWVELLNPIGPDATEAERFPQWVDV